MHTANISLLSNLNQPFCINFLYLLCTAISSFDVADIKRRGEEMAFILCHFH